MSNGTLAFTGWVITRDFTSETGKSFLQGKTCTYGIAKAMRNKNPNVSDNEIREAIREAREKMQKRNFQKQHGVMFRLLDDDENLCFHGVFFGLSDACGEVAFGPLDWAMANVGATIMEVRANGKKCKWVAL